jgi:hypothetical protein
VTAVSSLPTIPAFSRHNKYHINFYMELWQPSLLAPLFRLSAPNPCHRVDMNALYCGREDLRKYGFCGAISRGRFFCFVCDHVKAIPIKLTGAKIYTEIRIYGRLHQRSALYCEPSQPIRRLVEQQTNRHTTAQRVCQAIVQFVNTAILCTKLEDWSLINSLRYSCR